MTFDMKASLTGIFSALLASACCTVPMLLVVIGLGSGAAFIGRFHWLFLLGGLVVQAWAWTGYMWEKTSCGCTRSSTEARPATFYTLLFASTVVAFVLLVNVSRYMSRHTRAPAPQTAALEATSPGLQRAVIPIEGMSCAACEIAVRSALGRVPGVTSASVSVASKSATIEFNPARTGCAQLVTAIDATGYHASPAEK